MMIFVAVILVVLVMLTSGFLGWRWRRPPIPEHYQARVELYGIRRRFDVAATRSGLRRDAIAARRVLNAELHDLDNREP